MEVKMKRIKNIVAVIAALVLGTSFVFADKAQYDKLLAEGVLVQRCVLPFPKKHISIDRTIKATHKASRLCDKCHTDSVLRAVLQQWGGNGHFPKADNGIDCQSRNTQLLVLTDPDTDVFIPTKQITLRC